MSGPQGQRPRSLPVGDRAIEEQRGKARTGSAGGGVCSWNLQGDNRENV